MKEYNHVTSVALCMLSQKSESFLPGHVTIYTRYTWRDFIQVFGYQEFTLVPQLDDTSKSQSGLSHIVATKPRIYSSFNEQLC